MGRIAEALKRAERERQTRGAGIGPSSPRIQSVTDLPPRILGAGSAGSSHAAIGGPSDDNGVMPIFDHNPIVEGMSESLVTYYERSSSIAEQYRTLRTRLLSQNPFNDHRILAVTSSVPKEGKSVTTLNLAFCLAEVRHLRVLVMDGDLRRSSLAKMLNMRSAPGIAEVLMGQTKLEEAIQPSPASNLSFLAAGDVGSQSASELLSLRTTTELFRRIHEQFHYVIVDTPPATTVTDVGVIGQLCHGVLLVVRLNKAPDPLSRRAVRQLQSNNIPVIGCVVIGDDVRLGTYGYRSKYYGYYHYYSHNRGRRGDATN